MKLSIIIPCFNEDKTIEKVINNILEQEYKDIEIIVVDDFSDDKTRHKLKNSLSSKIDKLIFHSTNQGKGAAIRTGIKETTGEIILIQDADLEYDPSEYTKLINPILSGRADVVYGSRFIGSKPHRAVYFWHKIANNFLTLLSNIFSGLNLTDIETCYKVFKSNIIKKIKIEENGFGIEAEYGFFSVSFFAVMPHSVEFSIGHGNRGESNSHPGFPGRVIDFTFFSFRKPYFEQINRIIMFLKTNVQTK